MPPSNKWSLKKRAKGNKSLRARDGAGTFGSRLRRRATWEAREDLNGGVMPQTKLTEGEVWSDRAAAKGEINVWRKGQP